MTRYQQAIIMLAIGQAICLACGLWVSDQFLLSAVDANPVEHSAGAAGSVAPANSDRLVRRCLTLVWIGGLQTGVAYLVVTRLGTEMTHDHTQSSMRILHREKDLVRTRNAVIFGLAKLADSRDRETGQHLERIALYSTCLASALRSDPRYREAIPGSFVKLIGISSVLHDVGKVAIEDAVLRKAGPLTTDERWQMQMHSEVGAECIKEIERRLGSCNFLEMAREIAHCHHERWDGKGYPRGIAGKQIPLAARIVAIADVYDALASKRVYKDAYSHEKCVKTIVEASGSQFDSGIVDVFLRVAPQFQQIARRFRASPTETDKPGPEISTIRESRDRLIRSLLEQDEQSESLATIS